MRFRNLVGGLPMTPIQLSFRLWRPEVSQASYASGIRWSETRWSASRPGFVIQTWALPETCWRSCSNTVAKSETRLPSGDGRVNDKQRIQRAAGKIRWKEKTADFLVMSLIAKSNRF